MMSEDECEQADAEYRLRVRMTGSASSTVIPNGSGEYVTEEHLATRDDAARWAREYGPRMLETIAKLRRELETERASASESDLKEVE